MCYGETVHALRVTPSPEQILFHSREEAVIEAVVYAERAHVRAWSTADGATFTLLKDCRGPDPGTGTRD